MEPEDLFLSGLLELQYGKNVKDQLQLLADDISWAKNWPLNKISFWNAEAFMWNHKIHKKKRDLIRQELNFFNKKPNSINLDLGCGSYSYIPSVGFDFSDKMLDFNGNCSEKIIGDLEQLLPFKKSFSSITAIFVMNYVDNYLQLLSEIKRILTDKGTFVMLLSANNINDWQRQKEVNSFSKEEWLFVLKSYFKVDFCEKEGLLFYRCRKPY